LQNERDDLEKRINKLKKRTKVFDRVFEGGHRVSPLQKRVLTASILIPLVIISIFFLPAKVFIFISLFIFLLAAWEWTRLAGFETNIKRSFALLGMCVLFFALSFGFIPLIYQVIGIWSFASLAVLFYPRGTGIYGSKVLSLIIGALILFPAWAALTALQWDPKFLLYVMVLIWGVDTGAYFVGRCYGKHKLAALVSPGKTWEGVLGGLVVSLCIAASAFFFLNPKISLFPWLILSLITAVFSIIGDLFESLFKRLRNVKDSGTLLPGHGGILDRIDSLIAAMPIFWLIYGVVS